MRYYISDCHFFHSSINFHMDHRGFQSVEEMNEYMISQWNKKVRKNDTTVILGDLSVAKARDTEEIIKRLNGKKILIIGNHDKYLRDRTFDTHLFEEITPYREMNDDTRRVVLCHYPTFCYNRQNHLNKDGVPDGYMLYGHVHNTMDEQIVNHFINENRTQQREIKDKMMNIPCNMINCFCMFSDYTPLTLDEWIDVDNKRRIALNEKEEKFTQNIQNSAIPHEIPHTGSSAAEAKRPAVLEPRLDSKSTDGLLSEFDNIEF